MRLSSAFSVATLALASGAVGQTVQHAPSSAQGVQFRVNVPSNTASSGNGPIFIQVEAPSNIQWVGIGQGSSMRNANIFLVYGASSNNVTVSPRLATGRFEPPVNTATRFSLVDGTGISNGKMTANIRCDNCLTWEGGNMRPTDSASSWIWAMKSGSPLQSTSINERIRRHDSLGTFNLDLTRAVGGSSNNPFQGLSSSPSPSGRPNPTGRPQQSAASIKRTSHAVLMSTTFVALFPLLALSLYAVPSPKTVPFIHAPLQMIALCLAIVGFGIGVSLAIDNNSLNGYHPIIGIVVVAFLVLFQPALGLLQHLHFRKTGGRSTFGIFHRWGGRIFLVLGIVNGGLGFKYSGLGQPGVARPGAIAYAVFSALIAFVYTGFILIKTMRPQNKVNVRSEELKVLATQTN